MYGLCDGMVLKKRLVCSDCHMDLTDMGDLYLNHCKLLHHSVREEFQLWK